MSPIFRNYKANEKYLVLKHLKCKKNLVANRSFINCKKLDKVMNKKLAHNKIFSEIYTGFLSLLS